MVEQMTQISDQTAYAAIVEGAAIQGRDAYGVIALEDEDRVDFLQRMTTNNMAALQPGQSTVTILTSPTARILFVFTVVCRQDDLLLLPAADQAAALAKHLSGQIFFMDKVRIRNLGDDYSRLRLMGQQRNRHIARLEVSVPETDGDCTTSGRSLIVRQDRFDIPGFEILTAPQDTKPTLDRLTTDGAFVLQDNTAYEARRVELGRPLAGHELTEDYNPLEAGLGWACAQDKGCYTGQEIIARQITYDKITKTLVGLIGDAPLTPGENAEADGRNAGVVTSATFSPALDRHIALAIARRPHNEPGTSLSVEDQPAQVVSLPFVKG